MFSDGVRKNKKIEKVFLIIFLCYCFSICKVFALSFPTGLVIDPDGRPCNFEQYIKGVLVAEMPYEYKYQEQGWHLEALKALAVAARCVAVRIGTSRDIQDFEEWKSDIPEQALHGLAVDQTIENGKRIGMAYNGQWIRAHHYSHDAADYTGRPLRGHTNNIEDVWGGSAVPYLKAVNCNCKVFQEQILTWKEERGHGVGLCQFGAWEMANAGKNYKEILQYYYSSVPHIIPEDETKPSVEIISPTTNAVLNTTLVTISGTASDNNKVEKIHLTAVDGVSQAAFCSITVGPLVNWQHSFELSAGSWMITAKAIDAAGNESEISQISFTIDTTPPEVL